jgi:hypothetical protein
MKKISIGSKPNQKPSAPANADSWVTNRITPSDEPMKRLTIDIPLSLHQRVKSECALRGVKMADEVRDLLEAQFGEKPDAATKAISN